MKDIKAKFLSGGQKKKLVIALSLLSDPKVLLLDECFAALDVLTIKMLQEIIVSLQQETKITNFHITVPKVFYKWQLCCNKISTRGGVITTPEWGYIVFWNSDYSAEGLLRPSWRNLWGMRGLT